MKVDSSMNERMKMMIMITILNSFLSNKMMGILIFLLLFMSSSSTTTTATTKTFKELTNDEIIRLQQSSQQQQQNPHDISFIVSLNDETFEHMTQATTGQTTGSWLVWFYNSTETTSSNNNILFDGTIPTVNEWLEQHIILGKVDISNKTDCKRTKQRFFDRRNDTSTIPSFIYLYHKQMYHIIPQSIQTTNDNNDDSSDSNNDQSSSSITTTKTKYSYYNWNEIYKFCSSPPSDYTNDQNKLLYILYQRIPLPITYIDEILEQLIDNKSLFSGVAVMIMILGAIIGSFIEYCYDLIKNNKKTTTTTKKATNVVVKRTRSKSKHEKSIKEE